MKKITLFPFFLEIFPVYRTMDRFLTKKVTLDNIAKKEYIEARLYIDC